MSTKEKVPHIDLNNFEDSKFENCNYILTSPLSLQACKNVGLKPIELLRNDSESLNIEIENIRKNNVERARIERNKLIENLKKQDLVVNGCFISSDKDKEMNKTGKSSDQSWHDEDNERDASYKQSDNIVLRNSYLKEISFQQKRRQLQELEKEDKDDLKNAIEMKLSRAARNRAMLVKKRHSEIEHKREQFDNKVKNVSARRRRLDAEIQNYYRELDKFQKLSLKAAAEKSSRRLSYDTTKIQSEREHKDSMIRWKRQILEEESEERTQELLSKIVDQDRQDEEFMRKKLEKMMESRCYAHEAQKLREELRAVYNLDSFDKKVSYVEAVNRVLK